LSDGTTPSVTTLASWSSSNSSVASVSARGVVTGVAAGDADLTATYQTISGRARVTVVRPTPGTFTISGTLRDATSGGCVITGALPGPATLSVAATSDVPIARTASVTADTRVDLGDERRGMDDVERVGGDRQQTGLVTGVGPGDAEIAASYLGPSGSRHISLAGPPPPALVNLTGT
jgi:hypothetical protein